MPIAPIRRAVVLGITPGLDFAAGALIVSLMQHNPGFTDDIVIFHNGLTAAQQASFAALAPSVRFRRFAEPDLLARLAMPPDSHLTGLLARFSPLFLAKLCLPDLLDDYAQVLWLDADMLIRGPIDAVWNFTCLTWRPLPEAAMARRAAVLAAFADLPRDPGTPLLNGGLVGVARPFLDHAGSDDLFAMARRLLTTAKTDQVDEMALYLLAASRKIPVQKQPLAFNHPVTAPGGAGATILHAIGPHKFWNATPLMLAYPDWQAHQARWVAAGGAPYGGPVHLADVQPLAADAGLKAAQNRAFWHEVYARLRPGLPPGLHPDLRCDTKHLTLFIHGLPDDQHLRLTRHHNPQKLGLEAHLPPSILARLRNTLPAVADGAVVLRIDDLPAALRKLCDALP